MKKTIAILAALLLSVSSITAQTAEANASKIIDMTNYVVDMYNGYLSSLKKVRKGLETADNNFETLSENIERTAYSWDCAYIILRSDYREKFEKAAAAAPAFPEKANIQSGIKYVQDNTERLSKSCSDFKNYFVKKEYKQDTDWTTFEELYKNMETAYIDLSDMWSKTMKLAAEAGDRSELVLLKKSPIAEFIIPMKTDLSSAAKIIDKFAEDEVDNADIKNAIEVLKKAVEKNRVLTGKNVANLEKYSSKPNYEGYYSMMDDFIELATKLENLMDPANAMDEERRNEQIENTYSLISYKYNSLVENYNIM